MRWPSWTNRGGSTGAAPAPDASTLTDGLRAAGTRFAFALGRVLHRPARAVRWLVEYGTHGYPEHVRRRLMIVNVIAYLIAASTAGFVIQYSADYERFAPLVWINAGLVTLGILVPLSHRYSEIAGGLLIVVVEYVALFMITMMLSRASGAPLNYLVAMAAPFVVFGLERIRLVIITVAVGLALHLYTWFAFTRQDALIPTGHDVLDPLYVQTAITVGMLIAASVWYAFSLAEKAKAETDALLRNILPDTVVERLKQEPGRLIADEYQAASVMFTDISGFVALARRLGPEEVVRLLNEIVLEFDALAARHGVEKIKTIGDAYMAVAGVPTPVPDHAQRCVRLALDMLVVISRLREIQGLDLHIRIGIATGPLMAGVIGTQKFSYDVWGDTVNLASRLEGASERGRIQISDATYKALDGEIPCQERGEIEVRGAGRQLVWFVSA